MYINSNWIEILGCLKKIGIAAVTSTKYKRDIPKVTSISITLKDWQNNGTEGNWLSNSTPDPQQMYLPSNCIYEQKITFKLKHFLY